MALPASTPLLMDPSIPRLKSIHAGTSTMNPDEQDQTHQRPTSSEVVEEVKLLYSIAFPIIAAGLLVYGKSMISMLFMGRLGKEALAGGSLSIGIANITGFSVLSGLAMGVLFNAAEAVSTMGILLQATSLAYIFPSALSLAVSTRVGNELGANRPNKAKTSCHVAILCATLTSLLAMIFMTTLRNAWGKAFTDDESILWLTAAAMPVVGLCELGNCPQTTGCGALRGSARPALAVHINLGSFYGVGLPLAIVLGFVMKMGLLGLCLGLLAAQGVCACLMVFVLSRTDWMIQAQRARELIGVDVETQTIAIKTVC